MSTSIVGEKPVVAKTVNSDILSTRFKVIDLQKASTEVVTTCFLQLQNYKEPMGLSMLRRNLTKL